MHPRLGLDMIKAAREAKADASEILFEYKPTDKDIESAIVKLFPNETLSIKDLHHNLIPLENHLKEFFKKLETEQYPSKKKPYPINYSLVSDAGFFLYTLCKIIKPNIVVETGVAYGNSSSYVLQALHENKKGTLYSIDSIFSPWQTKEMIGSAIPVELKSKWNLILNSSSKKLPTLLKSLNEIDVFFHDSLHTSKNMMFEFETAWPFIKSGGFLLSDDISGNNVFYKFYNSLKREALMFGINKDLFGIIPK